jgi:hypothetical protein
MAVEVHRTVRRRGSHIFQTVGYQMAVLSLALRADRRLPLERVFFYFFFIRRVGGGVHIECPRGTEAI